MKKNYSTTLDENLIKQLKIQAVEYDTTANDIIEKALKDYFKLKPLIRYDDSSSNRED